MKKLKKIWKKMKTNDKKNVKRRNDMETLETNGTQFHRKYNQNWHLQFFSRKNTV